MRLSDRDARERAARIESRLERLETVDEATRALATEALQALMELYGEALARLAGHVAPETLAGDDVIAHVLLLHGLHPLDAETRVTRALEELRSTLDAHAAAVESLEIGDGAARVRMRGGRGCSTVTVRRTVEDTIRGAAPDLDRVDVEVVEPPPPLIPADSIKLRTASRPVTGAPATA